MITYPDRRGQRGYLVPHSILILISIFTFLERFRNLSKNYKNHKQIIKNFYTFLLFLTYFHFICQQERGVPPPMTPCPDSRGRSKGKLGPPTVHSILHFNFTTIYHTPYIPPPPSSFHSREIIPGIHPATTLFITSCIYTTI
jgi:hypothetical protein